MFKAGSLALVFAITLLPELGAPVSARPRIRPDQVWEREPELVGHRVSVEPVLRYYRCGRGERCPGGDMVATDVVVWKLRTVLRGPRGEEIEARFTERGRDHYIKDREVRADRWWRAGDVAAMTRVLRDPETALRAFLEWSRSDDPLTLDPNLSDRPVGSARPDHPDRLPPIDPGYPLQPGHPDRHGLCERTLLDKGYAPALLDQCDGVAQACALALLEKGYHPSHLSSCRGVEPYCAGLVLEKGYHPSLLSSCRADLSPACTRELLQRGYHPTHLSSCERVDDRCAVDVLSRGHHPTQLSGCRR